MNLHSYEPQVMMAVARSRRDTMAEAVRQERPAPRTSGGFRGPLCAALVRVGELLVVAGEKLRERYAPAVTEPCCRLEVEYG